MNRKNLISFGLGLVTAFLFLYLTKQVQKNTDLSASLESSLSECQSRIAELEIKIEELDSRIDDVLYK
jgi:peptidoglycan hydrolase CwlO-like protein